MWDNGVGVGEMIKRKKRFYGTASRDKENPPPLGWGYGMVRRGLMYDVVAGLVIPGQPIRDVVAAGFVGNADAVNDLLAVGEDG